MIQKLLNALGLYAGVVLGLWTTPIEIERRTLVLGPAMMDTTSGGLRGTGQFAGRTTLSSGTAFVTVSTVHVQSDAIIRHYFQALATVASGQGQPICVTSAVDGVSFALGYIDGQGRAPGGTVMWEITKTR